MPVTSIAWGCAECKSNSLTDDGDGNMVCTNCGLVAAERIFQDGEDKRYYADDDEDTRQTDVVRAQDVLLGTDSTTVGKDGSATAFRLQQAMRGVGGVDKTLHQCQTCLRTMEAKRDGLQHCHMTALEFCKKYLESPTTARAGRKILQLSVASLFAAARMNKVAVQLKELCEWASLEQRDVTRYFSRLLIVLQKQGIDVGTEGNFCEFYATKLELAPMWLRLIPKAYDKLKTLNPESSRDAAVMSAALVYEAIKRWQLKSTAGTDIKLSDIAQVANKTTSVILTCHRQDISPHVAELWRNEMPA